MPSRVIVERTDFVSVPVEDMERVFEDTEGNALMLHRRYAATG